MKILLTGAGSLGSSMIRLLHEKHQLTVIENSEETLARLSGQFPKVEFILEDFANWNYNQHPAKYVIHTAAAKHLLLGERHPNYFIDNNIIKTRKLFLKAFNHGVNLLFVSSDKAVEPCSLYGYTKAIGESLANHYNFSIARCGNFIRSSGSVVAIWEECIKEGKPLPITDPEMTRYFITLDDAAKDFWNGFVKGKKLIIPKMRKVKLLDLAKEICKQHKVELKYKIIGTRPGEKFEEKLRWDYELK